MTNKTQTMLTIALTVAVSALLVDRVLMPQAEVCATEWDVAIYADEAAEKVIDCLKSGSDVNLNDFGGGIISGEVNYYC